MKTFLHLWPLALLVCNAHAAGFTVPVLPGSVGVNIHFSRGHERDLDLIAAAGFRVVRMDFGWAGIERVRGQYDWAPYDELTANLLKRGIRPYYILDYSNPLYEEVVTSRNPLTGEEHRDTASPQHAESIEAFAKWAGAAANRYAGKDVIWEIWNEPNISFWKPKPNVQQYIALAKAACAAARKADPNATIVGPATSEVPIKFIEEFFASGILESLDAVSVHPYRNYKKAPETAGEDYAKIRELISRYAPEPKKRMPILSGEWGYASHSKGVTPEIQACFLARQQLYNLLEGIPVSVWYDWKNDGPDPAEREQNFGTVSHDLKPKPAYQAVQTLTHQLNGFHFVRRIAAGNEHDYALFFEGPSKAKKLAVWTTEDQHEAIIPVPKLAKGTLHSVSGSGESSSLYCEGGKINIALQALPAYLELGAME